MSDLLLLLYCVIQTLLNVMLFIGDLFRPADNGGGHSPLCPEEHLQNDPLDLDILTQYTLSEFDDQFREFMARILFHRCGKYKAIDVSKFLKSKSKDNREYCLMIIHQLGWGRMSARNQKDYNDSCKALLGVAFEPTLDESGLDGDRFGGDSPISRKQTKTLQPPLKSTIEVNYDYWADKCLHKEKHTRNAAILHLARNSHFENYLAIINGFCPELRAREMARVLNVIDLFGDAMKIILRMYWSEHCIIGFKQFLIKEFLQNEEQQLFCSPSEHQSLGKTLSDCGDLISELQRLMYKQDDLLNFVYEPLNYPVKQQDTTITTTKKGQSSKFEIEDEDNNSNEENISTPPPTGPITYPYGGEIAGQAFIRQTMNVIDDLNECISNLISSRYRLDSMAEWNENHRPLGMYIVKYKICLF